MHIYQKHILDLLRASHALRYSELQPSGVESSHFRYHLLQLEKDELVHRSEDGLYSLTSRGLATVDRLSENRINPHVTPKVITYTLLRDDENYYLYRKSKEPYLGTLNMVSGKLHQGESSTSAAVREVREKISLDIDNPLPLGVANVRISSGEEIISHFIAYIFEHRIADGHEQLETIPIEDISSRSDLAPDFLPIINTLAAGDFKNIDVTVSL